MVYIVFRTFVFRIYRDVVRSIEFRKILIPVRVVLNERHCLVLVTPVGEPYVRPHTIILDPVVVRDISGYVSGV